MSKIPHANRPGAFSNNDPDGDTFGKFLSDPMEEKPMTIRLQAVSTKAVSWPKRIGAGIGAFLVLWTMVTVVSRATRRQPETAMA